MNGRNAIYHALNILRIKKGSTVLLPAFHCTALVDPIIAYGARVGYYTVLRDLSLNLNEIETLAKTGVAAILYVHFMGFQAPVAKLNEIRRVHRLCLIEDCTHGLFGRIGNQPLGTFGDAAVFSFRKTLPVQDGGALVLSQEFANGVSPHLQTPWIYHARMTKWTWDSWRMKNETITEPQSTKATSTKAEVNKPNYSKGPDSHENPDFMPQWVNWPISLPSKWLLQRADPEKIFRIRVRNYERLHARLSPIEGVRPCFPKLIDGVCPLGYTFLAESSQRLDYRLRRLGVPAFSFGEVLHESLPAKAFPEACYLSKNLTILPVHQGLSENEIDQIADVVEDFFKKGK